MGIENRVQGWSKFCRIIDKKYKNKWEWEKNTLFQEKKAIKKDSKIKLMEKKYYLHRYICWKFEQKFKEKFKEKFNFISKIWNLFVEKVGLKRKENIFIAAQKTPELKNKWGKKFLFEKKKQKLRYRKNPFNKKRIAFQGWAPVKHHLGSTFQRLEWFKSYGDYITGLEFELENRIWDFYPEYLFERPWRPLQRTFKKKSKKIQA